MSIQKNLFLYLFVVAGVSLAFFSLTARSVFAATYTVDSTTDAVDDNIGDGVCATSGAVCTLRAAIQEANQGGADTITLPAGTYTLSLTGSDEDAAANEDLDFTDADKTTLNGAGSGTTTIDANGNAGISDRVVHILSGATVEFNDLTITGGLLAPGSGAGVYTDGTTTFNNVIVSGNAIVNNDGLTTYTSVGLYCGGGTVTLNSTTITNNTASGTGTVTAGGAGLDTNCSAVIDDSTFSNNTATDLGGGIVFSTSASTTKSITDTTVSGNSAVNGGGILISGSAGHNGVTLNRVNISNNTASDRGGGVSVLGPLNMTNATIVGNKAATDGGGVYLYNFTYTDVVIAHSTIAQNFSDSNDDEAAPGGGIYVGGSNVELAANGSVVASNHEGDPNNSGTWSDSDCWNESGGFAAMTYSLLGSNTSCTPTSTTGSVINPSGISYIDSAVLTDKGGEVSVLPISSADVTDAIAAANCTDASTNPLTLDARGLTRPENSSCDMGAYEKDQTNPVVTVTSGTDTVECGVDTWTDAGATVIDNFSSGLTASAAGTVTEETRGIYTITYTSTADSDSNTGTNTRTVTVQDTTAPTITVTVEAASTITVGEVYTDAGATASDSCAGDVSADIVTVNPVDVNTAGDYTVTYNVTDASGNAATQATRTVTVEAAVTDGPDVPGEDEGSEDDTPADDTPAEDSGAAPIVRANGKHVRIFVDGVKVAQKKVGKKKLAKKYRRLKVGKLYKNKSYTTVAFLGVYKSRATLTVFRLTAENALTKKVSKSFAIQKRLTPTLKFKTGKKRIISAVGKGTKSTTGIWTLTKKGELNGIK